MVWDLPEKEREFDNILTQIVVDTIKLDIMFSQVISFYFSNGVKFKEFESEIFGDNSFSLGKKAKLFCSVVEKKLPAYFNGLPEKMNRCLEIRNKLVHTLGIEEDVSGKQEKSYLLKKGKEKLNLKQLEKEFYRNYEVIHPIYTKLKQSLRTEVVSGNLKSCAVFVERSGEGFRIVQILLKDVRELTAQIYNLPKGTFDGINYEQEIKKEVRKLVFDLNPLSKEIDFPIEISQFEYPEEDYPEEPEPED